MKRWLLIVCLQSAAAKSQLPSFWIPSLTPSTENGADTKPLKLNPICPASSPENKHGYSLKLLVTVHFTEEKDGKSGETIRVCPSCKKGLNNGLKAMRTVPYSPLIRKLANASPTVTKPCGHVICKPCVEQFMTPHKDADPHAVGTPEAELHGRTLCYVCETDLAERKASKEKEGKKEKEKIRPGLVQISSEGTGFASGGNNMAKKMGTAFQC